MRVGYIGLGHMGGRLASRLRREHPLTVFDRSDTAVQRLVDEGADAAVGISDLASRSEVIMLCLPTSDHVRAVLFGGDGVVGAAPPGTVVVDQTTGDPAATRDMARRLDEHGLHLIDAPVSGGPMGADQGTIAIMVGATPEQFDALGPVLRSISPNVFHAGPLGSGHVVKLANNMLSAVNRVVSLEALALASKNGVDPHTALDIFLAGSGRNFHLETFVRSQILSGSLTSGFTLGLLNKDVRLACRLGSDSGLPLTIGDAAKNFYQSCVNEAGADADASIAALIMDRRAGTSMVPAGPGE